MLYAPTEFQALYYTEDDVNMKKNIPTLSSSFQLAKLGHVAIIKWIHRIHASKSGEICV